MTYAELTGKEIAGFRVTSLLGAGAMATVYRGENVMDAAIGRALKVIHPELSASPEFVQRFTEEARTLERLDHPNIVRFYGIRRSDGYLVMELELLTGAPVSKLLADHGRPMPPDVVHQWLIGATAGVAFAHGMGVVHRDLKPENLFCTSSGVIKVLDFGLARAVDDLERQRRLTVAGVVAGSPAYMAPEVCNGQMPTAAADVYALGLTAYELLLGHHPLLPPGNDHKSATQLMFGQVQAVFPPIQHLRPSVPPLLSDAIERALAKDPAHRFAHAHDLLRALEPARGPRVTASMSTPSVPHVSASLPAPQASASFAAMSSGHELTKLETRFALPTLGEPPPSHAPASSPSPAPSSHTLEQPATSSRTRWWIPIVASSAALIAVAVYALVTRSSGSSPSKVSGAPAAAPQLASAPPVAAPNAGASGQALAATVFAAPPVVVASPPDAGADAVQAATAGDAVPPAWTHRGRHAQFAFVAEVAAPGPSTGQEFVLALRFENLGPAAQAALDRGALRAKVSLEYFRNHAVVHSSTQQLDATLRMPISLALELAGKYHIRIELRDGDKPIARSKCDMMVDAS